MRLWNKRKPIPIPDPSRVMVAGLGDVDETAPLPWSVEQLHALGPVTGIGHRTFVPIVRSAAGDNPLGDLANS